MGVVIVGLDWAMQVVKIAEPLGMGAESGGREGNRPGVMRGGVKRPVEPACVYSCKSPAQYAEGWNLWLLKSSEAGAATACP